METKFNKLSAFCLITGSILMVLTMVLHPAGGNSTHLLQIKTLLIGSHSLAILCIPLIAFGFWGLSISLLTSNKISMLAYVIVCFGLFAVMIAATVNGLVLPMFLSKLTKQNLETTTTKAIITYGHQLNIAMDYIFICALMLAISIWSALIIQLKYATKWIGYYGLFIVLLGIFSIFMGYHLVGLVGFRIVVFALVSWICLTAFKIVIHQRIDNPKII